MEARLNEKGKRQLECALLSHINVASLVYLKIRVGSEKENKDQNNRTSPM